MVKNTNTTPASIPARLALEDGSVFHGRGFGDVDSTHDESAGVGEVVFNTAHCGYQEAITDPSYAGQILCFTAPMIGNYGIAGHEDDESPRPQVAGVVIRELSRIHSNYRATTDLSSWLASTALRVLKALTHGLWSCALHTEGAMRGVISYDPAKSNDELIAQAKVLPPMAGQNLAALASCARQSQWTEPLHEMQILRPHGVGNAHFKVAALDCGGKRNIYRNLCERGCAVHLLPSNTTADEILAMNMDGLFISNGPGDPAAVAATIDTLRQLLTPGNVIPTFGICLGVQLLALAMGARTYKLKFGHRGVNQPVRNVLTGSVEITSQNHGFAIDRDSLTALDCEITHEHLNDATVAGFRHRTLPVFGVQFHPEASPGPHDSSYLFDCFVTLMQTRQPITAAQMTEAQARGHLLV